MSSTHNGATVVFDNFAFPLTIDLTSSDGGNISRFKLKKMQFINYLIFFLLAQAVIDHSYSRDLLPLPIVVRSNIQEHQLASKFLLLFSYWVSLKRFSFVAGIIVLSPNGNTGNGTSNNTFAYSDQAGNTFNREVDAAFNVITSDQQSGTLAPAPAEVSPQSIVSSFDGFGVARLPGGRQMGVDIDIFI